MSYLVLARKLRPQTFDEIVGQEAVVRTLSNALASGRLHHAFLFCGPRGTGKTTTARILAKALNCAEGPTATPCNTCRACEEITSGTAVDVLEIDGASNTGVDDVRQLRENARYLPVTGRRKIYIIDEVHMLSVSAFNALLKTLEEPPPHVTFIFATTEPHKIPVTILSRCQRYDLARVSPERLVRMLAERLPPEGITIDADGLGIVAQASEGSVRDSLSLVDQVVSFAGTDAITAAQVRDALGLSDRETLLALSEAVLARDGGQALGVLEVIYRGGQDLVHFARAFLGHLRDLTVAALVRDPSGLVQASPADVEAIAAQVKDVDPLWLQQLFDRFAVAVDRVARSDSPRLVLEMAVVGLVQAEPLLPLGDLLERLESLEAGLGGAPLPPRGGGSPARPPASRSAPARGRSGGAQAQAQARDAAAPPASRPPAAAQPATPGPAEAAAPPAADPAPEAPAPDPAPPPAVRTLPTDPMEAWEVLVRVAERHSRRLAANLYRASLVGVTRNGDRLRVEIGLARDSFELRQLQEAGTKEELGTHMGKGLGLQVDLVITPLDGEVSGALATPDDTPEAAEAPPEVAPEAASAPSPEAAPPVEAPRPSAPAPSAPAPSAPAPSVPAPSVPDSSPPPPVSRASEPPRSLRERDEQWRREERARKRHEALTHAAVRDAVEILEGEVQDIHVVVD